MTAGTAILLKPEVSGRNAGTAAFTNTLYPVRIPLPLPESPNHNTWLKTKANSKSAPHDWQIVR
jgi:hypothetical protein